MPADDGHATASTAAPDAASATDSPARESARPVASRKRMILAYVIVAISTLLLIVGILSTWANRLLFSPDNWANTSSQLLANDNVRSTAANYVVDQLYANVNVANVIKSGLPKQFQPLASPAAGALRSAAVSGVDEALTRPRIQTLWAQANRAADQTFIAIVNGGGKRASVNNGVVSLNLGAIIDDVASRLGLPSNISSKLPASIGHLTIFKSNQLKWVQKGGNAIKGLALWLTILVPVLYALAILIARGKRRRMLMNVGWAGIIGGATVILVRSVANTQVTNSLTNDASLRVTVSDVMDIATAMMHQIAAAVILVAIILVISAWFAGPTRLATTMRLAIAPFMREHPAETYTITLGIMVLIFIWDPIHATGTVAGIITFTVLALFGTFMLRRQTIEEFPDARLGDATQRIRARIARIRRQDRVASGEVPPPPPTLPNQLRELSDLRDSGAITVDEYERAKTQLLHT